MDRLATRRAGHPLSWAASCASRVACTHRLGHGYDDSVATDWIVEGCYNNAGHCSPWQIEQRESEVSNEIAGSFETEGIGDRRCKAEHREAADRRERGLPYRLAQKSA